MTPGPRLELEEEPTEISMPLLPDHRVLRLHLRNSGDEPVELRRTGMRLLDEEGHDLRAVTRPPIMRLEPGDAAKLDVVYRVRDRASRPARLEHAGLAVDLATSAPRA